MQPRVVRLRDAPRYLGMDINRFNKEVRPLLPEVRIGMQGIAFDILDLDEWFDQYKGRCGARSIATGEKLWDKNVQRGSLKNEVSGKSISKFSVSEYEKVRERILSQKRNSY